MIFGYVKPHVDAHTLGVASMVGLLRESGYETHICPIEVSKAVEDVNNPKNFILIKEWILQKKINSIGFSYRLDPNDAFDMFSKLISLMDSDNELAMNLGETYLVTKNSNQRLGKQKLDLVTL